MLLTSPLIKKLFYFHYDSARALIGQNPMFQSEYKTQKKVLYGFASVKLLS